MDNHFLPEKIDRYEVRSLIAQGGMSLVYLAFDERMARQVAIKVLNRELSGDLMVRARFEREARTVAALEHLAIVPVYDFGEQNGLLYLVMRYMTGGSLAGRLEKGSMPPAEALKVVQRLAPALDKAHANGVVHRDLKPGNILFDQEGNAYLSDFGIAKLTQATTVLTNQMILGTVAYMSPEQVRGEENLDGRSDIYSLGIIIFEMLTGQQPYHADTPVALALRHLMDAAPDILTLAPNLPAGVGPVVVKALMKDRGYRYQTAADLVEALAAAIAANGKPGSNLILPVEMAKPARQPGELPSTAVPAGVAAADAAGEPAKVDNWQQERRTGAKRPVWVYGLAALAALLILVLGVLYGMGLLTGQAVIAQEPPEKQPVALPSPLYTATASPGAAPSATPERPTLDAPLQTTMAYMAWVASAAVPVFTPTPEDARLFLPTSDLAALVRLAPDEANQTSSAVSPDGRQVVFQTDHDGNMELYLLDLQNGDLTRLTDTAEITEDRPTFSPDGSRILFGGSDGKDEEIYALEISSGQIYNLSNSPRTNEGRPAFSPSGQEVVFDSDRSGNWEIYTARFTWQGLEDVRQVTDQAGLVKRLPSFFPDGRHILLRGENDAGLSRIYRLNLENGELVQLVPELAGAPSYNDVFPALSPDGSWLAFVSERGGSFDLYRMALATGQVEQLTNDPGRENYPAFSPDGKWLAFAADQQGLYFQLLRAGLKAEFGAAPLAPPLPTMSGLATATLTPTATPAPTAKPEKDKIPTKEPPAEKPKPPKETTYPGPS